MTIENKYFIPPYKVKIEKDNNDKQLYSVDISFITTKFNSLTNTIEKQIIDENGLLDNNIIDFNSILLFLKNSIEEKLTSYFKDNKPQFFQFLSDWMVYKIIGLENLMPLLIDDHVQEIYMDKPNTPLYIDHQDFGRCLTNIILDENELEHLKTRLCLEKNAILNLLNPSLKVELKTEKFHIRAALDIPPLASDGLSLNIRKLRKKIWTLPELIKNNMLTIEASAYLLFILKRRFNFTVIGEPGSGKTTLANAIDLLTPTQWRKITVEDVIESIEQTQFNKFQTRYSVSPFESQTNNHSKSKEIIKLLHRSPTWVFLGEIQTEEHSKALFEALSAGLVGIQTCHGRSLEMMIIRWINQHNIPLSSILTLDILIENSYNFNDWKIKRNVSRIAEVSKEQLFNKQPLSKLDDLKIIDIFKFDQKNTMLVKIIDLFETPTLKLIRQKEGITKEEFENEINVLTKKLSYLIKNSIFDPNKVINYLLEKNTESLKQLPHIN
ncbi:MAG TPA: ATPase, T2SS/T4P/T4SS family [Candidatus Bathyarchaeia archaeon]|nr:ATPase, T2SS/T4P/T4SS family [Candidatus Bathyarchaeia archaeon]